MAYQRKKKRVRFLSTGEIVNTQLPSSVSHAAYQWNHYIKKLFAKLQNVGRQKLFKLKPKPKPCIICEETDVSAFFLDYQTPEYIWLCQRCHKEHSQRRGSAYDQLVRHGIAVISWEDWKNGIRPVEV